MSYIRRLFFLTLVLCIATAHGQTRSNKPQIGYLYPGGARQGLQVRREGSNQRLIARIARRAKAQH